MEHGTFRRTLFIQDPHNVLVRVTVVNLQRQVMLLCQTDVLAEAVVLCFLTLISGAEVVQ